MKKIFIALLLSCFSCVVNAADAKWITVNDKNVNDTSTWTAFQKDIVLTKKPAKMMARIACDSKYWLWINGKLVVFEGELKRGPKPQATYYDEVDLAPALSKGRNKVSVLVLYFGKSSFSHISSGKAGLIIDADNDAFDTNASWLSRLHPAYGIASGRIPNFRLSESNVLFDANKDMQNWQNADVKAKYGFEASVEMGAWGAAPWGELMKRPTPMFKDYGVKPVAYEIHKGMKRDTLIARLPGNLQITPILDITDEKGNQLIDIWTNHSHFAGTWNVRAQYITRKGNQQYESLGWMNGEQILLFLPKGITVNSLSYRQTGYDTYAEGTFKSDNDFWNLFWQKALNTLYVNMRDTYTDCPERERAQWWGDEVTLTGEAFYSYSPSAALLMRKGMYELCYWQHPNGVIMAPVPGNHDNELPSQMLAAVSTYGFWNYYMNTADEATIKDLYPAVKRYLATYGTDANGFTSNRPTAGWPWGDWGENRDIRLIFSAWHYMALHSAANMADLLGFKDDADNYRRIMAGVKKGFNDYWNGYCYRYPEYMGATDERAQALAVVAGIADADKYEAIAKVLKSQVFCSPYIEKYVLEAYFKMGKGAEGMERAQKRLKAMVESKNYPTLWEHWTGEDVNFKNGSSNHAWSGGALTVIAQNLMGVAPIEAGYRKFVVDPQYVVFKNVDLTIPTIKGMVKAGFKKSDAGLTMTVGVPKGSQSLTYIPSSNVQKITVDGKPLKEKQIAERKEGKVGVWLSAGDHTLEVKN
ncbi:MAG: glycoside hydrolase [Prevotella sp.]|jgi:alpha-L-rhamnosidase|nr:glycoside hydrolase [Prevotella sp.]MCI1282166.1 glycoside hydrolase [Prevotella sp.]